MALAKGRNGKSSLVVVLLGIIIAVISALYQRVPLDQTQYPTTNDAKRPRQTTTSDEQSDDEAAEDERPSKTRPTSNTSVKRIKGFVTFVQDGDSLKLKTGNDEKTIRFWGIDAPEGNSKQPYAEQARDFTTRLCERKQVEIIVHDTDRYHRIVGEVILPDGSSANLAIVSAGLAWHYTQHAPNETAFADAESQARKDHRGLWSGNNPVAPWKWRRDHPSTHR